MDDPSVGGISEGRGAISGVEGPSQEHRVHPTAKMGSNIPAHRGNSNRNFEVTAPILYNKLPDSIKSASNVNTFKSSLKTYFFRQYF